MQIRVLFALLALFLLAACGSGDPAPDEAAPAVTDERTQHPAPEPERQVDEEAPKPALVAMCNACHGANAPSPFPDVPTIHGMPAMAIENALFDYRGGTRICHRSACIEAGNCPDTDMCEQTEELETEQIEALAAWYAALPFASADQSHDPEQVAHGRYLHETRCESCHTEGGTVGVEQASRLRGQHKDYLRIALIDYREGNRTAVGIMDANIKVLEDEEMLALIEFYASPVD